MTTGGKHTRQIRGFETELGSTYSYDPTGKASRYKTADGTHHKPMEFTVFTDLDPAEILDYSDVACKKQIAGRLDRGYAETIKNSRVHIIQRLGEQSSKIVKTRDEITDPDKVYLGVLDEADHTADPNGTWRRIDIVSLAPEIGMTVLEFNNSESDQPGEWTGFHQGHRVVRLLDD